MIALMQAGALYWLTGTLTAAPSWPASEPSVFISLLLACSYVPLRRFELWLVLAAAAFVAHVLVVDAVIERRFIPPYGRHFDTAWKLGVQIVLAVGFVLIFRGVLLLGAALFKLVGIDFFQHLIAAMRGAFERGEFSVEPHAAPDLVFANRTRRRMMANMTFFVWPGNRPAIGKG